MIIGKLYLCEAALTSPQNWPISFNGASSQDYRLFTNKLSSENETIQVVLLTFIKSRHLKKQYKWFQGIEIKMSIYTCSFPFSPKWVCDNCRMQMQTFTLVSVTAPFNNMRTLKFKAQSTNAFFATVNQMLAGSPQLSTAAERALIKSLCTVQTTNRVRQYS